MLRHLVRLGLVAILLAGCSSSSSSAPSTPVSASTSSSPVTSTVATTTIATSITVPAAVAPPTLTKADGTLDIDAVLAIFVAKHGAVDGVTAATPDTAATVSDDELADILGDQVGTLTGEAQTAVLAWLQPTPPNAAFTVSLADGVKELTPAADGSFGSARRSRVPQRATSRESDVANHILDLFRSYSASAGESVDTPITVQFGSDHPEFLAFALPRFGPAPANDYEGCSMSLGPNLAEAADLDLAVAHEAFHCFQYALRASHGLPPRVPQEWVREGTASWVGVTTVPSSNWPVQFYVQYLATPHRSVIDRGYDGVGFFVSLQESGAPMWRLMQDLVLSPTLSTLIGLMQPADEQHWAAAFVGDTGPWNLHAYPHPGAVNVDASTPSTDGDGLAITAPQIATDQGTVHTARDVVVITGDTNGLVRIGQDDFPVTPGSTTVRCRTAAGCEPCPDGGAVPGPMISGDQAWLAATNVDGNGTVEINFFSHDLYCSSHPAPTTTVATLPASPSNCVVGTWTSQLLSIPQLPDGLSVVNPGSASITFGADGSMTGDIHGLGIGGTIGGAGGTAVTGTVIGQFLGQWSGDGSTTPTTATEGKMTAQITIAGTSQTVDLSQILAGNPTFIGTGTYAIGCDSSTLSVGSQAGTTTLFTR